MQDWTSIDHGQLDRSRADRRFPVGDLAAQIPTIARDTTCDEVNNFLCDHSELSAVAIVDAENQVLGILNASNFLAQYSRQYSRELYGRRPISKMA